MASEGSNLLQRPDRNDREPQGVSGVSAFLRRTTDALSTAGQVLSSSMGSALSGALARLNLARFGNARDRSANAERGDGSPKQVVSADKKTTGKQVSPSGRRQGAPSSEIAAQPVRLKPGKLADAANGAATVTAGQKPAQRTAQQAVQRPGREGILAVAGLQKSYRGKQVVRGVTLGVRRGEAVGLLGPNGAGKTTCFYMITGLVRPDAGRIELDGFDITSTPMYRRARLGIGYLPQEASIFRGLSVENNIRAVLEVVEPSHKEREKQLDSLLSDFSLTQLRKLPSIALSGGERRRLEIARALATRPAFMLLDEPFAGIDPIQVGAVQEIVRQLTQMGIGVLITDHNVRETLGLVDRAYIIAMGRVLTHGSPEEIVRNPEVRSTYLGERFTL